MALDPNDLQWLYDLEAKSWRRTPHHSGKYGTYTSIEDLPINEDDRRTLIELLEKYRDEFVFEPGSGVFGFGVSLTAFLPPTYPDTPPTRVITVTSKQMHPDDKCDKHDMYKFVEGFTHTDQNKQARPLCGFNDRLYNMSYYDY